VLYRNVECGEKSLGEPERSVGEGIPLERVGGVRNRRLEPSAHLVELGRERSPAGVQLEQQRLGGLAREPQLAALRVVAEALRRHRRDPRREQLLLRDDGHLGNERRRVAADEDHKAAEAGVPRSLE
jgi:hypothetical protein